MKRTEESLATYEKAVKFAKTHLGEDHSLVQNLENVLRNAQESKSNQIKKNDKKRTENRDKVDTMKRTYTKGERPNTAFRSTKKV